MTASLLEHSIEKAAVQLRVADRLAEETDSRKFCPVLREEIPRDSAYQIRFFEIQQLFHSLEHNVTSEILIYIM